MKNSNDTIGNRTRDLPACSAVPQPNAPPSTPSKRYEYQEYFLRGDKGGRYVGLTYLPPSCTECLEIWDPKPPEPLKACSVFALSFALEIM